MKYIVSILLALTLAVPSAFAQSGKTKTKKVNHTVQTKHPANRKAASGHHGSRKPSATTYSNASIRKLQSQRADIQKKIREQEKALQENRNNVSKKLNELMLINGEIDKSKQNINNIEKDIHHINGNIGILNSQLKTLQGQLKDRQTKYIKSMRYMARHRTVQDKLMFIFSAKNLYQMYRRLRFVREYANYQRAQGEAVKAKQVQVGVKHKQLQTVKGQKNNLLYKGRQEHAKLESNKSQQQEIVNGLQKQQSTIRSLIAEQRKKDAALNAEIDRQVEIEVAKVRARQRKAEELARRKAAAEAAARENARRIAEAKAREQAAAKAAQQAREAEEAARKAREAAAAEEKRKAKELEAAATARKAAAEQAAREAEAVRQAAERKQAADAERAKKEIADAREDVQEERQFSSVDRMMNNGFEANKGRLPMPITGNYRIVSHFGQYNVAGLQGVTLDNKGINIMGGGGCKARAIYDGEVSAVLSYAGTVVVMLRHGAYISVYSNLSSASVSRGQHVSTRQILGTVGSDHILQFQLRKERAKLNPEAWLGR